MIVVDTSVWIDVLNDVESPKASRCVELLQDGAPLALTDVIFTEILQGLGHERDARRVEKHLRAFPVLRLEDLDDFALAARLYRKARRAGVTIRKSLDCLIAAPCVRDGVPILHADDDFDRIASCTDLE
ncbi:MAG: PIN domain nuclease, partial [Actinobacteria bacterium]|nr:PIN domain nuclease [Actinomycetota bacterium]